MSRLNLSDIAKLAGVSKSTASRVLSNHDHVSEKSRAKVMAIVEELNYKPNQQARMLNNKSSQTIGIIVPDLMNPYFPEIVQHIEQFLSEKGFNIILCNTKASGKSAYYYLDILEEMRVDGTILIAPSIEITEIEKYQRQSIVSIDGIINDKCPYVASDFYKGGFLAAQKLIENGCKSILHISGKQNYYPNICRSKGFTEGIAKFSTIQTVEVLSDLSSSKTYNAVYDYLSSENKIDGIFADNDSIAFSVLRVFGELNIDTPNQIRLIGYDDNFMIPMVYPLLSTIHQPIEKVAEIAVTTLTSMINNQQISLQNIVDVEYIKRNTTFV